MMTSLRKRIAIGMTVLSLGTAAFSAYAEETPAQGRHAHAANKEEAKAKWQEHFAQRQQRLHDSLKLTAQQEPAWATFIAAIKPEMNAAHSDRAAAANMTAPQRMEKHLEMAKQHIAKQESHLAALKTFYAVLSPEQQKIFDEQAKRLHQHRRGMMRHHH
ncbi:Spy/CpxP family protein refolding chaperone [Pseudoduganella violacea]|uniref:TRAP-type C4-dicarboxylate transport system substrate-binding protein n=1 Tax=Pseudoduganella violacea TaxID=1715466 RepID=A0A7W5BC70_9BURK|nr:Spy/CpxP family protein refolding chaperone [Pseudoduganella violacea]MBB3120191.1 TRAP-type C4-dicarboxylate transport system substrate-binding protein [Pseudoduganella violacea]